MPTHGSVINLIDGFLKEASNLDLAGDAKTSHPSANVDDKTKPATEGARSAENEADVKKSVPDTINDAAAQNTGGSEGATPNGDQGTTTMASDSGLKGNTDTPKKDHTPPAGEGPGNEREIASAGNWDKASAAGSLVADANALLADVAMLGGVEVPSAAAPAAPATSKEAGDDTVGLFKQAASQYPEDVEAGYVAAALLAQRLGLMKEASEDVSTEAIVAIQKEASSDAENYADYLAGFAEEMQKAAMPMGADPSMMAALAGAGDAGGEAGAEEMGEGAGEMEQGAEEMGAGAEEMGAGADEDEEAAAEEAIQALLASEEGEPGGGEEAGEEDLAEVLQDAGVDIPSLMAALQEGGGEEEEEGAPEVV